LTENTIFTVIASVSQRSNLPINQAGDCFGKKRLATTTKMNNIRSINSL